MENYRKCHLRMLPSEDLVVHPATVSALAKASYQLRKRGKAKHKGVGFSVI